MTRTLQLRCCLAMCFFLPGCANQSYVALLDNGDGTSGKVQVITPDGRTLLELPHQATRFTGPTGETFEVTKEKLEKDFAQAMKSAPKKPTSFLLQFDNGGANLTPESEADVAKILQEVEDRSVPDISVIGHTDTVGDTELNEKLGMERAKFVAELIFARNKIDPTKVAIESHGEKNLLVATPDDTEEARNRRVEVTIR